VPPITIGVQLAGLRLPFKKAALAAARMGAAAVEIDARGELKPQEISQTGLREVRRVLEELNLRVSAVGFHTRRGYDVEEDLEERVAATKGAMTFAQQLGAAVVVNQLGRVPEKSEGPSWSLMVEALTDLGRHGIRVGARLAAQTGAESGADLARLIAALPPHSVGVDLDPGHLIVNGFSPLEAVQALGPNVLHVHARDGVRDASRGRGLEVPLGRGSADFPALLGALEEFGYRGAFTVARDSADDPLAEIADAVQYLASLSGG